MHERYLGDSYDIVKRYWRELLSPIAPVFAHPRFIAPSLRAAFTGLTGIEIWNDAENNDRRYSLLLDPHTGIPVPDAVNQHVRVSHAPITFLAELFDDSNLAFIICFDQTSDRQHEMRIDDQREAKREALKSVGIFSFYYLSHAPFLFASKTLDILQQVRCRLTAAGIPEVTSSGTRVQAINDAT